MSLVLLNASNFPRICDLIVLIKKIETKLSYGKKKTLIEFLHQKTFEANPKKINTKTTQLKKLFTKLKTILFLEIK